MQMTNVPRQSAFDGKERLSVASSSSESWKSFSQEESTRYAIGASAPASRRPSPEKPAKETKLLDFGPEEVTGKISKMSFGMDGAASQSSGSGPGSVSEETIVPDGTRKKWSEMYAFGEPEMEGTGKEKEKEVQKDWSKEGSLLDLD